ncbi:MAG TPA: hypothetical protein VHB25_14715 [Gemmatimonadaceae bacterium]|nr:hypothetical protein [Gemmatimonadaceae bacterium]
MKVATLTVALALAPGLLVAQQGSVSASASVNAQANVNVPANYSAESRAKIDAAFQAARAKHLPDQPMRQRMAEGQAKAASDAQVASAVAQTEARLDASQSAMIRAGRANPQPDEVTAGAQAMERGATDAQIEALAKHAPSDRSLTVAFNVLSKLEANGQPVDHALAQIQSKLDASASDDALASLAGGLDAGLGLGAGQGQGSANGAANGAAAGAANGASGSAAGGASAGVNAAAKGAAGAAAGVTGSVTGAVKGAVTKKP